MEKLPSIQVKKTEKLPRIQVKIFKYQMKVRQKRPLLTFRIPLLTEKIEWYIQIDVRKKKINLTNFQTIQGLAKQMTNALSLIEHKKSDISKSLDHIFISIDLFLLLIQRFQIKIRKYDRLVQAIEQIKKQIDTRVMFLDREEDKRNKSFQLKQKITFLDKKKEATRLKKKFEFLLKRTYEFRDGQSFNQLYERVKNETMYSTKYLSSMQELKFDKLKNKYKASFQRIIKMKGISLPTKMHLPSNVTSLYIMRTDIEICIQNKYYNIVKVGKTNQSIFDYEKCLYEDYKCKILFQYVYLGIFEQQKGKVIDHYFHDRLVKIPESKFFIFNYKDNEQNIRVSQQFYIMTEEFLVLMQILLSDYTKTHRHYYNINDLNNHKTK